MDKDKISDVSHLHNLHTYLENIKQQFQHQKSITNYTANAALQNALFENKDVKHQFLTFFAYLMFLDEIMNPTKEFSDATSSLNEMLSQCDDEKRNLNAKKDEEALFEQFNKTNDVAAASVALNKDFEEIKNIKNQYIELSKKMNEILQYFDEKCTSVADSSAILNEQLKAKEKMNQELSQHIVRLQPNEDLIDKLNKLLNSELMQAYEKQHATNKKAQFVATSKEVLSGVKLIATQVDYDILEVFYVNTFFKKSSVEVKVTFHLVKTNSDRTRGPIKDVNIRNSPVKVDDLIEEAITLNCFATVVPMLQHRLSET